VTSNETRSCVRDRVGSAYANMSWNLVRLVSRARESGTTNGCPCHYVSRVPCHGFEGCNLGWVQPSGLRKDFEQLDELPEEGRGVYFPSESDVIRKRGSFPLCQIVVDLNHSMMIVLNSRGEGLAPLGRLARFLSVW
jgi:hypothetical protein